MNNDDADDDGLAVRADAGANDHDTADINLAVVFAFDLLAIASDADESVFVWSNGLPVLQYDLVAIGLDHDSIRIHTYRMEVEPLDLFGQQCSIRQDSTFNDDEIADRNAIVNRSLPGHADGNSAYDPRIDTDDPADELESLRAVVKPFDLLSQPRSVVEHSALDLHAVADLDASLDLCLAVGLKTDPGHDPGDHALHDAGELELALLRRGPLDRGCQPRPTRQDAPLNLHNVASGKPWLNARVGVNCDWHA